MKSLNDKLDEIGRKAKFPLVAGFNGRVIDVIETQHVDKLLKALRLAVGAIDRHHLVWNHQDGTCSSECSKLCLVGTKADQFLEGKEGCETI